MRILNSLELIAEKAASYNESLTELSGFKVAIDADLLLSKVTAHTAQKSLKEGNASIDKKLQANLVEILNKINTEFKIEVVVVISGLKPPCLRSETASLEHSHALWSTQDSDPQKLLSEILSRYGASFY